MPTPINLTKAVHKAVAYTDGACHPNPGVGGWGYVLQTTSSVSMVYGSDESDTTNNKMELQAAIEVLRAVDPLTELTIVSDSQYVVRSIGRWMCGMPLPFRGMQTNWHRGWIEEWQNNGWHTGNGVPVKNVEQFKEVWYLIKAIHRLEMKWIKGHVAPSTICSEDRMPYRMNALADTLAARGKDLANRIKDTTYV